MRILISILLSIFLGTQSFAATLTAGCTPVVAQGGSIPQIQCASIYDTGNTNATGDVGIAEVNPAYTLDINGTIGNSNGDLASVSYSDYSSKSTITGWSGTPMANIYTKKLGKTVFVIFYITGTSNATTSSFTVPYTSGTQPGASLDLPILYVQDNGSTQSSPGLIALANSSAEVTCYKTIAGAGFTASGTKLLQGEFTYQSAT